jgi:membrane protein insertase Oxa1/YidC/SpoIIIJ
VPVAELLDNLLFRPLMLICEGLFLWLLSLVGSYGAALVLLGISVNLLLLPLYYQMERSGQEERARRASMQREVARIHGAFKGRERYFYVRTIHRHYQYKPLRALFTASDLFLQILVFSTAYRYLKDLPLLVGVPFLWISDLSKPDGLLRGVHLLPLLMTAANVASVVYYVDDKGKRRQGFLLAALFLGLLYSSPSGLVLYWTSSNVFSWLRNFLGKKLKSVLSPSLSEKLSRLSLQE